MSAYSHTVRAEALAEKARIIERGQRDAAGGDIAHDIGVEGYAAMAQAEATVALVEAVHQLTAQVKRWIDLP